MKKIYKHIAMSAAIMTAAMGIQSCTSESPFSTDGEGLVKMNVSINSRLTRAMSGTELEENCVVRISDSKGLLHRWVGLDKVPKEEGVYLKYGSYTAEAWSGVEADYSYDDLFYKGSTDFSVSAQNPTTQVAIVCKITNVVASVDEESVNAVNATDINVSIASSKGGLDLNAGNFDKKIYFTMPDGDNTLIYTVTGKNQKGEAFTKTGEIEDVKPAHEYRLRFQYTEGGGANEGGAFFDIVIDDTVVDVNDEVVIYSRPQFSWLSGESIDNQLVNTTGTFTDQTLRIAAFGGFKRILLSSSNADIISQFPDAEIELITCTEEMTSKLNELGIKMQDGGMKDELYKKFITFTGEWLNSLPASQEEIVLTVTVDDEKGKSNSYDVRIANTDAAIKLADPIVVEPENGEISSTSVTFPVTVADANAPGLAVQYREVGTTEWTTIPVNATRATTLSVTISGLKPATTYEYRSVAGAFDGTSYEFESSIETFVTTKFIIPNASFEDWSTYSASTLLGTKTVILPGAGGNKDASFWGSGNEGGATANKILTDKSTDMRHSGTYSARLGSASALGIIAAGNIFTGYYVKTDGTNGVLSVGREYDGTFPTKLRVYANYRPGGSVTVKAGNEEFIGDLVKGGTDQGQIYVALTTEPVEIRTNPDTRKLFDVDDPVVLAYGQVTWKEAFGPDGQLQAVEIPIEYNERSKTNTPTHLVIVCSASKYGDYFCGSASSVMYLDDFELLYE